MAEKAPRQFEEVNEETTPPEDLHPHPPRHAPLTAEHLAAQLRETADRLLRDGASRADLKLLNTALKELRYCFKIMAPYRGVRKVTVFGSARMPESDGGYQAAVEFGRRMAAEDYMVITGAGPGIMEAGHVGAGREKSIGVNILLPFEQGANKVVEGDPKLMNLKYFFTRKLLFVKESDAVALFPGGFGTQDEGYEALTLVQTGKSHLFPIVMVDGPGDDYWIKWHAYVLDVLLRRRLISEEDLSLYRICANVDEAVEECLTFYKVFHSMRYVRRDLVFRLRKPLCHRSLTDLRKRFADIVLGGGTFEQGEAWPEEQGEFPEFARLSFQFNRRNMGRLRQLVDFINREAEVEG